MNSKDLKNKGLVFVAKGHKPLCATEKGLLTYHKQALYLYNDNSFKKFISFPTGIKQKMMSCFRVLERMVRSEPQSAVSVGNSIYVARRHEVLELSLEAGEVSQRHVYRERYIHTNRLCVIKGINGFKDCVAYGEYQPNAKREEVCVWSRSLEDPKGVFEIKYTFDAGAIRHIHALIPDAQNACVYILTGDEDAESGIWRATNNFSQVEPLLVGNQAYRSCIAYTDEDSFIYSTDIPSRQNSISKVDLSSLTVTNIFDLPGTCTVGCKAGKYKIFSTSVETQEPVSRSKKDMFKYLLGRKFPAGIKDKYPRVYIMNEKEEVYEWLKFEKDFLPAGLFRFGRVLPVYDDYSDTLYLYPSSVKKYDGRLYSVKMVGNI